ncbi:MAG: type II toxin-antitoxin system RelB/DinJ family antitoxin [Mariprofundaceae bacterium]
MIRARLDEQIKNEASDVLEAIGMNPSEAFRLMMTRIAKEKKLPFSLLEPNEETISAIREAREGRLPFFNSVDDLMADLNADD